MTTQDKPDNAAGTEPPSRSTMPILAMLPESMRQELTNERLALLRAIADANAARDEARALLESEKNKTMRPDVASGLAQVLEALTMLRRSLAETNAAKPDERLAPMPPPYKKPLVP